MTQDRDGHWRYSPIDWDEFKQVLAGNGPCNRERIAARASRTKRAPGCARRLRAYAEKRSRGLRRKLHRDFQESMTGKVGTGFPK